MNGKLQLRCEGVDAGTLIERALASGFPSAKPPDRVEIDLKPRVPSGPWTEVVRHCDDLDVYWDGRDERASLDGRRKWNYVKLRREAFEFSPESVLALIRAWPFEACLTESVHPSWWFDLGYRSGHGWAFALKGAGHRLCSARILDRGPWRILRDEEHDVTMFQFHDLDAPADVALEQARPGHALLNAGWHYVGHPLLFRNNVEAAGYKPSFYDPGSRTSIVLVQDREVSTEEMGVAAATRVHQIYAEPVAQVAFVYMDEATARRQLPALWLYGLEVRAMTAQGERRIDLDYEPPPPPALPAWVERLGTALHQRPGSVS
jgi:hypothetical protein